MFFCWFLHTFSSAFTIRLILYILGCLVLFWKFWPKMGRRTPELKRQLRTATVESREDSMSKPSEPFECCDRFAWCQECPVSFTYLLWFSIGVYYTTIYCIKYSSIDGLWKWPPLSPRSTGGWMLGERCFMMWPYGRRKTAFLQRSPSGAFAQNKLLKLNSLKTLCVSVCGFPYRKDLSLAIVHSCAYL